MLAVLEAVVRVGLGAMFVYSALAKIDDPGEFAYSVSRYKMLPEFTVGLFSLAMPAVELLTGLAMLFTRWMREASLLVFGMMVMFIIALSQALFRGLEISCGCFGVPSVGGRQEILMADSARGMADVPPERVALAVGAAVAKVAHRLPGRGWRASGAVGA